MRLTDTVARIIAILFALCCVVFGLGDMALTAYIWFYDGQNFWIYGIITFSTTYVIFHSILFRLRTNDFRAIRKAALLFCLLCLGGLYGWIEESSKWPAPVHKPKRVARTDPSMSANSSTS